MTRLTGREALESTMPCIRLSPSASVTRTDAGVILASDLGTFQITGSDLRGFLEEMVPLLDGSRDQEALIQALAHYSRPSVTAFLGLLQQHGLIEAVPESAARWRGSEAFFRAWTTTPAEAMTRLAQARVLVVGLDPWGVAAAIELAAAGIGALRLIDDAVIGPEDVALIRGRGEAALGVPRRTALSAMIAEQAPWCRVGESSLDRLDAAESWVTSTPWSLLVAAIPPVDSERVERVAGLAHRAGIVSLWSHFTGTTAVLGPLVMPGSTACRVCATMEALNPSLAAREIPAPWAAARAQLLGHLVAMEALRVLSGYTPSELGGRLRCEDLTSFEGSFHTLVRMPRCRICGEG
jgi:hypothetical protein